MGHDSRDKSKLIQELKAQNRQLRKQVAALRKQLDKRFEKEDEDEEPMIIGVEPYSNAPPVKVPPQCPICQGEVSKIDLGVRMLYICQQCGHRNTRSYT